MWNGAIDFIDYTPSGQRLWQMQLSVQIFHGILGEKYWSSLRWLLGVLSLTYVLLYLSHCMYYCVVSQIQIIIAECLFPHTVWSMYGMEQLPLLITPPPANGSDRCSSLSNSARQHYIAGRVFPQCLLLTSSINIKHPERRHQSAQMTHSPTGGLLNEIFIIPFKKVWFCVVYVLYSILLSQSFGTVILSKKQCVESVWHEVLTHPSLSDTHREHNNLICWCSHCSETLAENGKINICYDYYV